MTIIQSEDFQKAIEIVKCCPIFRIDGKVEIRQSVMANNIRDTILYMINLHEDLLIKNKSEIPQFIRTVEI